MRILQVSPQDVGGGAEKVALDLHRAYRGRGLDARLAVRFRRTDEAGVEEIGWDGAASTWSRALGRVDRSLGRRPHFQGRDSVRTLLAGLGEPRSALGRWRGVQGVGGPGGEALGDLDGWRPDVIHAHNLHGAYFDLNALPGLSKAAPFVWTLHDTWAFTGHCAYFIACPRWQDGCGACPDLRRAPAVRRDRTTENWGRKRQAYASSKLHVVTPSRWLMAQLQRSMLVPASARVIPYGIDLATFSPGDRNAARAALGLPASGTLCLFAAVSGAEANPYKDFATVEEALARVRAARSMAGVRFICLGGAPRPAASDGRTTFVGRVGDPALVARFHRAADVFVHAAHADNFPLTVLEAQAVGVPVVATAVGGIPEQVVDGETGFLVPEGDSEALAQRLVALLGDRLAREAMGRRAAERAWSLFSLDRQVRDYLGLYAELSSSRALAERAE